MSKRTYRAVHVQSVVIEELVERLKGEEKVVFGCDVAKDEWRGALMLASSLVVITIRWLSSELREVIRLLLALRDAGLEVRVVAEPTGTYGDAFGYQVRKAGLDMFMVSPKHTHDYAEIYDGVPSKHDTKDAAIVAKLHLEQKQPKRWPVLDEQQRDLRAQLKQIDWLKQEQQREMARLEAVLARHWPELARKLDLNAVSLHALLAHFGSAQAVAHAPNEAREVLRKASRGALAADKIQAIVSSAEQTIGVPPSASERQLMMRLGRCLQERRRELREQEKAAHELLADQPELAPMNAFIGKTTTALVISLLGNPTRWKSARSMFKFFGINLRERSSGKFKGQLKITKRGSGVGRRWLFLAALRLIQAHPIVCAWVEQKARSSGGKKMKAIIALMRKLVSALKHVAKGEPFDPTKLFDVRRLKRLGALPQDFHPASAG